VNAVNAVNTKRKNSMSNSALKIANFVWFQSIWWLVVLLQNASIPFVIGLLVLWLVISSKRYADAILFVAIFLVGMVVDSSLTFFGIYRFDTTHQIADVPSWLIPVWLGLLWSGLAGTLLHSMTLFQGRPLIAAAGGAVFAPLSYVAGANFGAVTLGQSILMTYVIVGAVWAFVFPAIFYVAHYVEQNVVRKKEGNRDD